MGGNLAPVTKSGEQLFLPYHAFRENRLPFVVRVRDMNQDAVGRIAFMRDPRVARGDAAQSPICTLNIALPDTVNGDSQNASDIEKYENGEELREIYSAIKKHPAGKWDLIYCI